MVHKKVQLTNKRADGYIIPLGPLNLVNVVTSVGMVGCGAFDVEALNKFNYPAARECRFGPGCVMSWGWIRFRQATSWEP